MVRVSALLFVTCTRGSDADAIFGSATTQKVYEGWLGVWRGQYVENDGMVPELEDDGMPTALKGVQPKVVVSSGGAAGGVVTEGMGYAIMVEGIQASNGDSTGLSNGLSLVRAWLGMVFGPNHGKNPWGGGNEEMDSATKVDVWPYGVSAIEGKQGAVPAGVAPWKYPVEQCAGDCQGAATDGDEDAALGMVYLSAALGYPADFVDMTMRTIIAFASADLGFPGLYRTIDDGTRVFVPKGGSQWGGLLSDTGKFASSQAGGCYNPSYFAPGHYRTFRDFVATHWTSGFESYLPSHLDGTATSSSELQAAFDGAIVGGYNLLQHSSCDSGVVANWVGSDAPCSSDDEIGCAGVPWANTPYVGSSGTCMASGTAWGAWGADASRTPWRIAMDYILYPTESTAVKMYDTSGKVDSSSAFNAQAFLNRIAKQYTEKAQCDGGQGACIENGKVAAYKLQPAFAQDQVTCDNVPNTGDGWWSAFMSYPTFTAFVAPYDGISTKESVGWLDTFASLCDFSSGEPDGDICATTYFENGQEVISTMIMSGTVKSLAPVPPTPPTPPTPPAPVPPAPTPTPAPPSDCPGGSLYACISDCPTASEAIYAICVSRCQDSCPSSSSFLV
jgi:hypothetical protein